MGEFPDLGAFLEHVSLVMDVESGEERRARFDHDPARGEGAGVRSRLSAGLGGGPVSHQRSLDESGLRRARGGAPARLCRPDPRAPAGEDLFRPQPARARALADFDAVPLRRRTAARPYSGRRIRGLGAGARLSPVAVRGRPGRLRLRGTTRPGGGAPRRASANSAQPGSRPPSRFSGSILEGSAQRQGSSSSAFRAGSRVFHNKFGPGAVVAVDGSKLTVDFDKAGRKLVMDSFVAAES